MSVQRPPEPLRADTQTAWVLKHYIWKRCVRQNEHAMGCVVGREGSGKSHTALKIGEAVDPGFNADRVSFSAENFVERFRGSDLGAGDVVVLDEAGVDLGNRTWYEDDQIVLNKILQTVRDENMAAIFTLPALEELDTQTENRLLWYLEMTEKVDGEFVRGKWKRLDVDRGPDRRGTYEMFPRRRINGRQHVIKSVAFTPPSDELVENYEQRKQEFKEGLYDSFLEEEEDEDEQETDPREIASQIINDGELGEYVMEHPVNGARYIKGELIAADKGISKTDAGTVKSLLERQIDLEQFEPDADKQTGMGD